MSSNENGHQTDVDEKIRSFLGLKHKWDYYDAEEVSQETVDRALTIAFLFKKTGAVDMNAYPLSHGGVLVDGYYKIGRDVYVEAWFDSDNLLCLSVEDDTEDLRELERYLGFISRKNNV